MVAYAIGSVPWLCVQPTLKQSVAKMSSPVHDLAALIAQIDRYEMDRQSFIQTIDEQLEKIKQHGENIQVLRNQLEFMDKSIKAKNAVIQEKDVRIYELTQLCNKLTDRCDRAMRAGFEIISSSSDNSDDDSNDGEATSSNEAN